MPVKLKHLRTVDTFVVHCSATKPNQDWSAADIDRIHRAQDWLKIGYHFVIRRNGEIEKGREVTEQGSHVGPAHNWHTLGICLIGGLDDKGQPANTFTPAQFDSLESLLTELRLKFGDTCAIVGHRDLSPDLDGDGVVEPHEWVKQCPCFDVSSWAASRGF